MDCFYNDGITIHTNRRRYNSGLVPQYDWQVGPGPGGSWGGIYVGIQLLEASEEYRSLAGAVAFWKQSGVEFFTEYKAAYTAMDVCLLRIFGGIRGGGLGLGLTFSVITTSGLLAYRYRSTIEEVMADKTNYNNNPAVLGALNTFNGNPCIAKNGHYTEEETEIVLAGCNISSDVKAVNGLQSKSRDSGEIGFVISFLITNNIAKTMTSDFVFGGSQIMDFCFDDRIGLLRKLAVPFTMMLSQDTIPILMLQS